MPGDFKYATAMLILILLLLVRPQGLLGTPRAGRIGKGRTWTPFSTSSTAWCARRSSPQTAAVAIAVIGLNIHFGFTGLLNIGQSGFMLLGAYGFAISIWHGLPLIVGVLIGFAAALVFALVLGAPDPEAAR